MAEGSRPSDLELDLKARVVSAAGASVVSALVVNPLDVVKTRMQAQAASGTARRATQLPSHHPLFDKWAFASCPPSCERLQQPRLAIANCGRLHGPECALFSSTWDGMRKIVQREGARVLWRGTDVALLMAVPMVGIYLPLYDELMVRFASAGPYAPLLAGSAARTAAVLCTSPLELVKTRLQAALHAGASSGQQQGSPSAWQHVRQVGRGAGVFGTVRGMWTGVGATLARDVPFSAIYWGSLERIRGALLPPPGGRIPSRTEALSANFIAGSIGGAAAAVVTTPLDVVKTRTQLAEGRAPPVLGALREIARQEGVGALFTGMGPRAARAAPACAIVLVCYEGLKAVYRGEGQAQTAVF